MGLNGFQEVCGPEKVQCLCNGFRVVGDNRREERRDREGFSEALERWAMKRNEGQLFRLHGSTDMRVESRVRVGDRSG